MTTPTIQKRIARAIEIKQLIATLEAELKEIKTGLTDEAEGRSEEHERTEGGGWSWRHKDADDNVVCVTQPAPKLKSTLDPEASYFPKVKEAAGRAWSLLFFQVPAYKPVDEFRVKALAALPQAEAKKLIKLVTSQSSPTVSFEVAQKEAA